MTKTFVISAFPACGKTYCFKNHQEDFSILDSDSSDFSWVKDSEGKNTKERNPDFPQNYIEHIKKNIGKFDVIFVSSHDVVRKALADNEIRTIIVYPNKTLKSEWIRRFRARGNDEGFINFISDNWYRFIDEIENEDYGFLKERLNDENSFLDARFLHGCFDNSMGNLTCLWANG